MSEKEPVKKVLAVKGKFPLEPVIVTHMVSALLAFMSIQDLLLEKACLVNFGYSNEICTALQSTEKEKYPDEEQAIQKFIGPIIMWQMVLMNLFPTILVFLMGAWSDKFGRKLPILWVLLSFIFYNLILTLSSEASVGAGTVGLLSALVVSVGGSNAVMGMAIFSYVADTTPTEKLSQRTALTGMCYFLGLVIGMGLRGFAASQSWSFFHIFGLSLILEIVAFFYLLFFIKDVRDEKAIAGISTEEMIKDIFNLKHITNSLTTVFKKRKDNDHTKLYLLLLAHALVLTPMFGEGQVSYLFARYQFNWDGGTFSAFMTYKTLLDFGANFISMGILSGMLKLSDHALGIVAGCSAFTSFLLFSMATVPTMMYIAPLVALFAGSLTSVPRALIFKIVPTTEVGKVNSFIGALESFSQLALAPLYTLVYTATFEYFTGAFYLLSAAYMVPPIFIYLWLMREERKGKQD